MYRKISMLLVGLAVSAASLMLAGSASAATSPTLGCQVISNHTGQSGGFRIGRCGTRFADSSYVLDFGVANGHDFYSWSTPRGGPVVGGCNASTPFCDLVVRAKPADQDFTVQVVTNDAFGTPVTLSATASIPAVCGKFFC